MSDSPCHTIKEGINKIDEYVFREDRKIVVNFKIGERMRKMFIQSASLEPSFVSLRSMVVLVGGGGGGGRRTERCSRALCGRFCGFASVVLLTKPPC